MVFLAIELEVKFAQRPPRLTPLPPTASRRAQPTSSRVPALRKCCASLARRAAAAAAARVIGSRRHRPQRRYELCIRFYHV